MRRQRRWQQVNVKYVQGSPCARVAGRINNKGFWWKKRGEAEEGERKKKRGGKGILWGSCLYAGLFLSRSGPHSPFALSHSLARIFRLLDPFPVVPRSALPAPSMAIKILSATLLKNYRASPLHPRPRRAPRENLSRSRQLSTNAPRFSLPLHLAISPLYLFWFVWVSPLSVLVAPPYPPFDSSSGFTLCSVPCSLL